MAGLIAKLRAFARSSRGQAAIERARREARKPENRQRLERLRARLGGRRSPR